MSEQIVKELRLLKTIASMDRPTIHDLVRETGTPKTTVTRHLKDLRDIFKLDIRFVKYSPNESDDRNSGYYVIQDWGVIDQHEFMLRFY